MKKFVTILAAGLFTAGLVSCQKDDAEVTILSPVAGDFVGKETCPPSPAGGEYAIHIYNTAANTGKDIFIDNIYDIHNKIKGTVDNNTITIAPQPYEYVVASGAGAGTYAGNISATGKLEGDVITLNFKLDGDLADECTFVGNRAYRYPAEGN